MADSTIGRELAIGATNPVIAILLQTVHDNVHMSEEHANALSDLYKEIPCGVGITEAGAIVYLNKCSKSVDFNQQLEQVKNTMPESYDAIRAVCEYLINAATKSFITFMRENESIRHTLAEYFPGGQFPMVTVDLNNCTLFLNKKWKERCGISIMMPQAVKMHLG